MDTEGRENGRTNEDWEKELEKITKLIDEEYEKYKEDNQPKREIYCQLELLRLDYTEQPHVFSHLSAVEHADDQKTKTVLNDSIVGKEIHSLLSKFDLQRKRMAIKVDKTSIKTQIIHLILSLSFVILSIPVLIILLPFRLLHPFCRSLGIKNNFLPIDMVQKYFSRGFLISADVTVSWEGINDIDTDHNTVGMFSHGSNLDPFILASGPLAFKFIGKKILFLIPVLGWIVRAWGHIPIDRSDRMKAIASLDEAVSKIHKWGRSIAISPEGTRSTSGRLADFKKGPFHIAKQVGLPITPFIISDAFCLWPPKSIFSVPGTVTIRALQRVTVEEKDDPHTLLVKVRRAMLKGSCEARSTDVKEYYSKQTAKFALPLAYLVIIITYYLLKWRFFS